MTDQTAPTPAETPRHKAMREVAANMRACADLYEKGDIAGFMPLFAQVMNGLTKVTRMEIAAMEERKGNPLT